MGHDRKLFSNECVGFISYRERAHGYYTRRVVRGVCCVILFVGVVLCCVPTFDPAPCSCPLLHPVAPWLRGLLPGDASYTQVHSCAQPRSTQGPRNPHPPGAGPHMAVDVYADVSARRSPCRSPCMRVGMSMSMFPYAQSCQQDGQQGYSAIHGHQHHGQQRTQGQGTRARAHAGRYVCAYAVRVLASVLVNILARAPRAASLR